MSEESNEIIEREAAARAAIKDAFGTDGDEFGVTGFVTHHLEELDGEYWKKHLSTDSPEPTQILALLELQSHWGGDEELENFDFTLPGEVTNYVICVKFDGEGEVAGISMES